MSNNTSICQSDASSNYWGNASFLFSNNGVFDNHCLRGRNNRNDNYSVYVQDDSYQAQYLPTLMKSGGNKWATNSNTVLGENIIRYFFIIFQEMEVKTEMRRLISDYEYRRDRLSNKTL